MSYQMLVQLDELCRTPEERSKLRVMLDLEPDAFPQGFPNPRDLQMFVDISPGGAYRLVRMIEIIEIAAERAEILYKEKVPRTESIRAKELYGRLFQPS